MATKLSDLLKAKKRPAGTVIKDGHRSGSFGDVVLPPVSQPSKPGPRQLSSTKKDSESIPMDHHKPGTFAHLWAEVLMGLETETCLYQEPELLWLCVRANHSARVVVFHSIKKDSPLAKQLLADLPLLNPQGEELPEDRIERIWQP